jgi:hypothetical protein
MQYGTSVFGDGWNNLLTDANKKALFYGQRVKVKAVLIDGRMERLMKSKFMYLAEHPGYFGPTLCGEVGPNGKPCLRAASQHKLDCLHISFGATKGKFVLWHYVSQDYNPHPVREVTSTIYCNEISAEEAIRSGVPKVFA